jgi:Virulence factor
VARYRILSWQDIPSVIKASGDDGAEASRQLPDVFQQEIDRQAMRQGLTGSSEYLAQWAWSEPRERRGDPDAVLDELSAELERELLQRRRADRAD